MSIFRIALNNLKRRKIKMLFLMLGLIVGVATVVSFVNILKAMEVELGDRIDEFGPNSIILPRSEGLDMNYNDTMGTDVTFDIQKLTMEDIPKISASSVGEYINIISPKLVGAVETNQQKTIIVGIDSREEFTQKPWLSLKQQNNTTNIQELSFIELPPENVILGSSAAKALNVNPGELLLLDNKEFKVFGILNELGSEDDGLIYANLIEVQTLLNKPNELSMIEVSAYCNNCPIEEIVVGLEESLPNSSVTALWQAAVFREETIGQFSKFGLVLSGMVLLIAAMVVLKTMLSSITERTREIGIFRAIGFRRAHIIKIIFIEVGLIGLISGILGFLIGSLAATYAGPYMAELQGQIPIDLQMLLPAILLSVGLAIVVSAYPAIKAARLDPAEALRYE
jgi:putative ABC transport system permease protein